MPGTFGRIDRWRWLWRPVGVCVPARARVGALRELPIPYHMEEVSCKRGAPPPPLWQKWSALKTVPVLTAGFLEVHAVADALPLPARFCVAYVCMGEVCVLC